MMRIIIVLSLVLVNVFANDCIENRAAFDIGSGTTKLKVAQVDVCSSKILKILFESDKEVGYKQNLQESQDNNLSKAIFEKGLLVLRELKLQAQKFNPSVYVAVATSAFRTANNGIEFAERLAGSSKIQIKVISQTEEAIIGFTGASAYSDLDLKDLVVWDIGGGSMQITSYEGNNNYSIYEGKLASVSFKNHIIKDVKEMDLDEVKTPNPISQAQEKMARRDAKILAKLTIPSSIIHKILSSKTQIVGIGGVHGYSVGKKLAVDGVYNKDSVDEAIKQNLNLSDEQIGGEYASTDISNLILVSGFMEALGITQVKVAKVNLADGILINP